MERQVCPWWLGYVLVSPIRRLWQDPRPILRPHVAEGMTVLEPGCGMGYFTLPLARMVGPIGRVVAVDLQTRMLDGLRRRASRAGLAERIELRQASPETLGVGDLAGLVDFVVAFAMVHELTDAARFFSESQLALRPSGRMLLAEPRGHVDDDAFRETTAAAEQSGLRVVGHPDIWRSHACVLEKPA